MDILRTYAQWWTWGSLEIDKHWMIWLHRNFQDQICNAMPAALLYCPDKLFPSLDWMIRIASMWGRDWTYHVRTPGKAEYEPATHKKCRNIFAPTEAFETLMESPTRAMKRPVIMKGDRVFHFIRVVSKGYQYDCCDEWTVKSVSGKVNVYWYPTCEGVRSTVRSWLNSGRKTRNCM